MINVLDVMIRMKINVLFVMVLLILKELKELPHCGLLNWLMGPQGDPLFVTVLMGYTIIMIIPIAKFVQNNA